jgi:hypothetical protein
MMQQHVVYFHGLFGQGKVLIFGPVLDPTDNLSWDEPILGSSDGCWGGSRKERIVTRPS